MIPELPGYLFAMSWAGVASFVVAWLLPFLAALLSKQSWPGWVKGVLLLLVSAVKVFIEAYLVAGADFHPVQTLYAVGLNFAVAVVAYFGVIRGSALQQRLLNSGVKD